jgi:hypothetical protein
MPAAAGVAPWAAACEDLMPQHPRESWDLLLL